MVGLANTGHRHFSGSGVRGGPRVSDAVPRAGGGDLLLRYLLGKDGVCLLATEVVLLVVIVAG